MRLQTTTQMKKIVLTVLVVLMSAAAFAKHDNHVRVLSMKMDVVYFKVGCELIGASMDVYNEAGVLIFSQTVTDHRVIVDFYAEPSGVYTIHVKKNGQDEAITYAKSTESHAASASADYLTVTQN